MLTTPARTLPWCKMAAEFKLIARYFYPALARFALQSKCCSNCLRHLNQPSKRISSSSKNLVQYSKCLSSYSTSIPQSKIFSHSSSNPVRQPKNLNNYSTIICDKSKPFSSSSEIVDQERSDDFENLAQNSQYFSCRPPKIILESKYLSDYLRYHKQNCYFPRSIILPENYYFIFERSSPTFFRQLEPPRRFDKKSNLCKNAHNLEYLKGLPKSFFWRRRKNDDEKGNPKRRIPKLILIQNPFTWLMIKIDFSVLRKIWDPAFQEKEFKFGTKQAISKVTHVISDGQYSELNGLLTKAARLSLMRELDRNWSEKQRSLLALKHDDIQISSPRKVYFIRIADKKYCDVDMAFLALKWAPINSIEALIFTEIFARFHREYTPHSIPEWTIAYFKVTRFEVLRRKPKI